MSSSRHKKLSQLDAEALNAWGPKEVANLARQGDTGAARDILRDIAETIELSMPIERHHAFYIAEAFRKIVDKNIDAAKALGVSARKAGRPRGGTTHDKSRLGAAYWLLLRHGSRPEAAVKLLSRKTGADRRTIQRAAKDCAKFRKRTKQIDDDLLKYIVGNALLSTLAAELWPAR